MAGEDRFKAGEPPRRERREHEELHIELWNRVRIHIHTEFSFCSRKRGERKHKLGVSRLRD